MAREVEKKQPTKSIPEKCAVTTATATPHTHTHTRTQFLQLYSGTWIHNHIPTTCNNAHHVVWDGWGGVIEKERVREREREVRVRTKDFITRN